MKGVDRKERVPGVRLDVEPLDEALGFDLLKLGLVLDARNVSAGDLLLVDLKMPPSSIGTYSNLTPVRLSIAGIASWLRKALGLPKSNRNCGAVGLTAISLMQIFLYDRYHLTA